MISFIDMCKMLVDIYYRNADWRYEKKKILANSNDSYKYRKSRYKIERDIIILGHTLEKGLSHKSIKPKFGLDVAYRLRESLLLYMDKKPNLEILGNGVSILNQYIDVNLSLKVDKKEIPSKIEFNGDNNDGGAYETNSYELFSNSKKSFDEFAITRRSVRLFDQKSKKIDRKIVEKVVEVAKYSPSACNRQATRLFYTDNTDIIREVCKIQGGARGFGENAGAIIIVCADLRYYTVHERRLPMLDCGLFTMTLVYSLFANRIGSCILNGSFSKKQENLLKDIINIDDCYMVGCILVLNSIDDYDVIKIAKSERRPVKDFISWID
ncbi:MAG: hypothetical protein E7272_01995 [Pseudobutyrivibrio ruminis]|uniref:Nitroreductase domain-containing protein n=1 Tax=Pseudobutyrivibrio ruminis TaxID=46206 RepID=A0A927U7J3_9FIRM|nr:hypothetical protein [Pseudobutyrivibrio ruminis]